MAKRGRPRHPDILTPREWEVLALLREGLSNEKIAERLDITKRTAKYHVSEILSKLGVSTREEAARWRGQEARPWWAVAASPLLFWRKLSFGWLAGAVVGTAVVAVAAGVALLVWGLVRTEGDSSASFPSERVTPPDQLVWEGEYRDQHIESLQPVGCGDAETAERYGLPMMLDLQETAFGPPNDEDRLLGLEPVAYEYVPQQVNPQDFRVSPDGWELSARVGLFESPVNRFATTELFLRRLDQPDLLFRYEAGFCNQDDGSPAEVSQAWAPGGRVPKDAPKIMVQEGVDGPSLEEALDKVSHQHGPNMELLRADQQSTGDWVVQFAGDAFGPAPPGHVYGFELTIFASGDSISQATCCIDFVIDD